MSDYLPIAPLGVGTAQTESLSSLFCRMAQLHSLSLSQLARHLSNWWSRLHKTEFNLSETTLYATTGCGINGYGPNAEAYIRVIATAMGLPHLERTTLLALRASAALNGVASARSNRAWCPACFAEAVRIGDIVYDRLLWTLQAIKRCPDHRILLETCCPTCGETQPFYHRQGRICHCWKCFEILIPPANRWTIASTPYFGERDCCELIEAIAKGDLDHPQLNAFNTFVDELGTVCHSVGVTVRRVARSSGTLIAQGKQSRPSLKTMLSRAHVSGVSLVSILTSPCEAAKTAGQLAFEKMDWPHATKPRKPEDLVVAVRDRLEAELAKLPGRVPPSFMAIAREFSVSTGFLRHHHNPLVTEYIRRRNAEVAKKLFAGRVRLERELSGGLLADYLSGQLHSQAELVELLAKRCSTTKYLAQRVMSEVLKHTDIMTTIPVTTTG